MSPVNSAAAGEIGVGIDTARYGHDASFLFADCQPAAKPLPFTESSDGYAQLRERLEQLRARHPQAVFRVRIDAAGQYATNLQRFLRDLPLPISISVGEPARNKHYCRAHFPKRKSDPSDSFCQARYAVVERPAATPDVPQPFYHLSEIASRLESQVRQSTRLINQLHNLLARAFPELPTIVNDLSADYVLKLLSKYPTAERIAQARETSLKAIPHLSDEKAKKIQAAARKSVASLRGTYAEELIREVVTHLGQGQAWEVGPAGHDGNVAEGERPGPPLPVYGLLVGVPAQPGTPGLVCPTEGTWQERQRGAGTLHAQAAAPGVRRLEDRPAL